MSQHLPFSGISFQPSNHQPTHTAMPTNTSAAPPAMAPIQQAAFSHNAQLPGIDMTTVLQGITPEQLAYIGQLYQAGHIPLPPAQGLASAQAPSQAQVTVPSPSVQQNGAPNNARPQEDDSMALDREEGEWEDGEAAPQAVPDFLRPPPTGPRKRSGSVHLHQGKNGADKRTKRQPSPPRQPHGYDRRRPAPRPNDQASSPPRSHVRQRRAKHDAARTFILAAYRAGYSFDDLTREVNDSRMLRVLFRELGLNAPVEANSSKQKHTKAAAFSSSHAHNQRATSVANEPIIPVIKSSPLRAPVAKPAPKPVAKPLAKPVVKPVAKPVGDTKAPASADRSTYLAKLQAAKNKRNEDLLASSKAAETQAPSAHQPSPITTVPTIPSQPTVQRPKKGTVQTELLRKRLEALKGEQAIKREAVRVASQGATTSAHQDAISAPQTPSMPMDTPINAVLATAPTHQEEQTIVSPAAQPFDFTSQFPGLPGLFMTGTPPQVSTIPRGTAAPQLSTELVAAAAPVQSVSPDLPSSVDDSPIAEKETSMPPQGVSLPVKPSAVSSGQATPKHSFNQSKYDSNDDSVIIHVSDEEESELDDMEEDEVAAPAPAPAPALVNRAAAVKPGPLRNFPAPTAGDNISAPGTPGATTPGGTAYHRKLQEIDEMHRRIAEMQKQPKKPKLQPVTASTIVQENTPSALPCLPVSASVAATVVQPIEEQPESSQQMEVKLAQLEEEAVVISEQRQAVQNIGSAVPMQAKDDSKLEDVDSEESDDDDDDAMDLSSGEDSDSDDDHDVVEASIPEVSTTIMGGTNSGTHEDTESTSSDDSDSSTESEESDEDYEPAPAPLDATTSSSTGTITGSIGPSEHVSLPDPEPQTISSLPIPQTDLSSQDADLAPELQPSTAEQDDTPEVQIQPSKPYYKPYESPLRMFRDYRFHPQFTSDVQGGFKSLTYSNKIDPTEAMCPNELSTGACQDQGCIHQHFHNTAINDAELLRDLGTRNAPWKTGQEKLRWNEGLSNLVRQLRTTNQGTDVNAIAARIAQYRRDFVNHPDQILNLKFA